MRKHLYILMFLFFGCHPDKNKIIDPGALKFQSTDASELFFKNVRRSYYDLKEQKEAAIELYTFSDYSEIDRPLLKPTIAYNWRNDFVSIMLDLDEKIKDEAAISILIQRGEKEEKILYSDADIRTQTTVAVLIFNEILNGSEINLVIDRQKKPLFKNNEEKEMFRVTVFDFLRFVELR